MTNSEIVVALAIPSRRIMTAVVGICPFLYCLLFLDGTYFFASFFFGVGGLDVSPFPFS
jgi:hypothetical protein